ncbi:MAG: hypothetical protein J2P24_03470 [Streptosporangiales bacterium]|nr:hypothetical protein [Streptosporangiales bacterium]MBO0890552.1 hypothetical protein [Acidothermales bacterium]
MTSYDATSLRERLDAHRAEVDEKAKAGYLVEKAERAQQALRAALDRWDSLDDGRRDVLADAVLYVVDLDDAESDVDSPMGFDDDLDVVRTALAKVAPDIRV